MPGWRRPTYCSEELVRASILQRLNETGKRDIKSISETVRDYYFSPDQTLKKLGIKGEPAIRSSSHGRNSLFFILSLM